VRGEREGCGLGGQPGRDVRREGDHGVGVDHPRAGRPSAGQLYEGSVRAQPLLKRTSAQPGRPNDGSPPYPPCGLHHPGEPDLRSGLRRRPSGKRRPSLAIFDDSITPNAHAIARRWVLFDNFYVDGEVSADGHEWSDAAFANDYNEKTWPQIYSDRRAWDLTSGEAVANRRGAYLWDAARR